MKKSILLHLFFIIILLLSACSESSPSTPMIKGVEEGKVYGNPIKITLEQEEKDVEYIAKIDERQYDFGDAYAEEGEHTLQVSAVKGKQSTNLFISFEIDTSPPVLPEVIGIKENETYYKTVKVDVIKEEGIQYEFRMDETKYELNTPIMEEGKHIFKVIATKEKNNRITEKTIPFTIDNDTYTQKEVDYFTEIAIGSEYGGSPYIKKWATDIRIRVGGNPTNEDLNTLSKVAEEVNEIIPTLQLSIVNKNENIAIYFVPQGDFRKYIPGAVLGNWAYFRYYTNDKNEINKAIITIGTFGSSQKDRDHHIREEITQALGMGNDSPKYKDSIFHENKAQSLNVAYSELDKKVIKLLYRQDILAGMDKIEVLETLKNRIVSE